MLLGMTCVSRFNKFAGNMTFRNPLALQMTKPGDFEEKLLNKFGLCPFAGNRRVTNDAGQNHPLQHAGARQGPQLWERGERPGRPRKTLFET